MNAVFTRLLVGTARGSRISSVSGLLSPARRTTLEEVPLTEGERARGSAARGRGPIEGFRKEPA